MSWVIVLFLFSPRSNYPLLGTGLFSYTPILPFFCLLLSSYVTISSDQRADGHHSDIAVVFLINKFYLILFFISGGFDYHYIDSGRCRPLLMFQGYTYSKQSTYTYYCSKKEAGCKVRVRMDKRGCIVNAHACVHDHPPPKYIKSDSGPYVKISS